MTSTSSKLRWTLLIAPAACVLGFAACNAQTAPPGSDGGTGGTGVANTTGGSGGNVVNPTGGSAGTGVVGGSGGSGVVGGAGGGSGTPGAKNYQLTGHWPELSAAVTQVPGTLNYQKVTVHNRFLAESCSIADYNNDGNPDVSSGMRWFEGPAFTVEHIFRDGHNDLPRDGLSDELVTGVSDDWADFPWDVNGDGFTDIINIASCEVKPAQNINPAPMAQTEATAYWYQNPGAGWETNPKWTPHLMHADVRHEHKGLVDVNGDGKPELFAACKGCNPQQTKGYYSANWADPTGAWTYTAVTGTIDFPFDGTGWMHGLGFGDVTGDGKPDMLDRVGVWQQGEGTWTLLPTTLYDGNPEGNRGAAHMFTWDIDGDNDNDIFAADWAHGEGLAWYEQTAPGAFTKHKFMGTPAEAEMYGGLYFTQPHAAQAVDMDGDGVRDIVTGKMRFAHPNGYGDPDLEGPPVIYVFKTVRDQPGVSGAAHFEPILVDDGDPLEEAAGVGRQLAVGHLNTDGVMDFCVGTKLGLYVFLGM